MLTRPEAADPAVEELKRRARRRLVGAVVLALAAAVILPLLLESDPKPLGDDVSIQIPPIDNGKFITRLPPAKGADTKAAPNAAANVVGSPITPAPKQAAVAPDSRAETKAPAATAAPGAADTADAKPADAPATPAPAIVAPPADTAPPPQSPGNGADHPDASKAAPPAKAVAGAAGPAPASPAGSLVVQVAAFEDAKAASALSMKLKSAGYPAYIDTVKTSKGTLKRVRTGPYATREIADTEMGKLKTAGYRGVVTAK
jgi:DedD protein